MLNNPSRTAECLAHVRANKLSQEATISRIFDARAPRVLGQDWAALQGFSRIEATDLKKMLASRLGSGSADLAIAISHDHYLTIAGGIQNCVGLEENAFRERLWTFLHLCPGHPLPTLADDVPADEFRVLVTVDGMTLGILPIADVIGALSDLPGSDKQRWVLIHQLLGYSPGLVQTLIMAVQATRVYFWTHDLFAHCPSVHLLRNDATFCGGPPVSSGACGICHAGAERATHVERMRRFFAEIRPTLLSPSQTILDLWRKLNDFAHEEAHVLSPCSLHPDPDATERGAEGPLRVAFLGFPAFHKGWDVFEALALWFSADTRYRFFRLGASGKDVPGIAHHPVEVSPRDRLAMVNAVAECSIDVVVNWSRCYESFSFTTIEGLAGGAFVVARRGAGNVFPLVSSVDSARGIQVSTEVELQTLFFSGRISELARSAPRRAGRLEMGIGAADLVTRHPQ